MIVSLGTIIDTLKIAHNTEKLALSDVIDVLRAQRVSWSMEMSDLSKDHSYDEICDLIDDYFLSTDDITDRPEDFSCDVDYYTVAELRADVMHDVLQAAEAWTQYRLIKGETK